jgi:VCBS repeat-containing protein
VAVGFCLFAAPSWAQDVNAVLGDVPPGKSVTIRFNATVTNPMPAGVTSVSNQGTVSGGNFAAVLTDDPDAVGSTDPTVTVVNRAPVVADQGLSVAEGTPNGTLLGTLAASDVDTGQTLTFAVTGGTGVGVFSVSASGQVTVLNTAAIDYESGPSSYTLDVTVTDNGAGPLNDTATVTITETDGNDAPVVADQGVGPVAENSANGTVVGTVVASDPDAGQTLSYAITAGNTGGAFAIAPGTGVITVATSAAVDFETSATFSLTVEVTDNGVPAKSDTATVTVTVSDANDAPVIAAQSRGPVAENAANGTLVGVPVVASDADAGQALSWSITAGNTGGAFAIDPATGQLSVATSAAVDFETTPSFSLTVQVTDNAGTPLSSSATVTVGVTDVVESSSTTLTSLPNPSVYGEAVTFTATVTLPADPRVPAGNVTFKDGVTPLGTVALNGSGQAVLVFSSLSVGSHNVTAEYAGDAGTAASTSAPVTQVVNLGPIPFLTIGDVSVAEGAAGTTNLVFTVTLSSAPGVNVSVNFATSDGTALSSSDYQSQTGTLTFTGSEVSKTITVLVNGDTLSEPGETLLVSLSGSTNATILDGEGVGTITNDDVITYSLDDVTVVEGDAGTTDAVFTVTLSGPSSQTVSVSYQTADGTASAGADYVTKTGSVDIAPGLTTGTISIQVQGDTDTEPDEYFSVSLTATSTSLSMVSAIPSGGGIGTITDDDTAVLGDVNRDGTADVLLRQSASGDVRMLTSSGSVFANAPFAAGIGAVRDVYYADATGDGHSDLVTRRRDTGVVEVYASDGTAFTLLPGTAAGGAWAVGWDISYDLYFSDVTGDGRADLIGRAVNGDLNVLPVVGNEFSAAQGGLWSYGWTSGYRIHLADVTGDGRSDLIGQYLGPTPGLTGDVYVGISSGTRFQAVTRWTYGFSAGYELYPSDVDADGDADLVARYDGPSALVATGDVLVMRSDGTAFGWNGEFAPWTYGWGSTYDLLVRDVNGDGRADLVGRHSGNGEVNVAPSSGAAFVFDGVWATGVDSSYGIR